MNIPSASYYLLIIMLILARDFLLVLAFMVLYFSFLYCAFAIFNQKISHVVLDYNKENGFPLEITNTWHQKTIKGSFPPNWTYSRTREMRSFPLPPLLNFIHTAPRGFKALFFLTILIPSLFGAWFLNSFSVELITSLNENFGNPIHIQIDTEILYMIKGVIVLLHLLYLWLAINNYVQVVNLLSHNINLGLPICFESSQKGLRLTVRSPSSISTNPSPTREQDPNE